MLCQDTASILFAVEDKHSTRAGLCLVDHHLGTCYCGEVDRTDLPLLCALLQPRGVMINTGSRFCGALLDQMGFASGYARESRATRDLSLAERAYVFMADGDFRYVYKVAQLPSSEDLLDAREMDGPLFVV